jgi:drug/metabolite transporter (DMT)-like permease
VERDVHHSDGIDGEHDGAVLGRRVDPVAVAAAVLALVMAVVYVVVIHDQDESAGVIVALVLTGLLVGAAAAAYGARKASPHRAGVLMTAGFLLGVLGLLALLTIGLPIIVAGGLCLIAASRAGAPEPAAFPPPAPSPGQGP